MALHPCSLGAHATFGARMGTRDSGTLNCDDSILELHALWYVDTFFVSVLLLANPICASSQHCCFRCTMGQAKHGGVVIVDSTRRGKDFPDALLKTIPIWCAVLNQLFFDDQEGSAEVDQRLLALNLHPDVPPPERHMIEAMVPQWVASLRQFAQRSNTIAKELATIKNALANKPLRAVWASPTAEYGFDTAATGHGVQDQNSKPWLQHLNYHPLVLLSASESAVTRLDFRQKGHSWGYIPGAGDDEEHWAAPHGLTADLFWVREQCATMASLQCCSPSVLSCIYIYVGIFWCCFPSAANSNFVCFNRMYRRTMKNLHHCYKPLVLTMRCRAWSPGWLPRPKSVQTLLC